MTDYEDVDFRLQVVQNRDASIVALRDQLETEEMSDYLLENRLVFRKGKNGSKLLYVPAEMQANIIWCMRKSPTRVWTNAATR